MSRQALRLVRSKSMLDKPKKLRIFAESGPLIALAIAAGMVLGIVGPSSAQFFNFGGFQQRPQPQRGGGWFGNDSFEPLQQHAPQPRWDRRQTPPPVREDFSKAPPPEKRETVPERQILVLGDAMADWLAYGLEDAYSEKPDAIVVMLGLDDRMPLREPAVEKIDGKSAADNKADKKDNKKDAKARPDGKPDRKPDDKPADAELSPGDAPGADQPPVIMPEKRARSPDGVYEFREERWVELYNKKIEEMIGVLRSKGVPVLWVGLPVVRGPKATADTLFLDSLYRDAAGKAGITYVDVWDGFVDEAGRFLQQGPDFEGQIRRLRSYDGVYFTKAGARKLAHYVEREINRLLAARSAPIVLPTEPATPDASGIGVARWPRPGNGVGGIAKAEKASPPEWGPGPSFDGC